MDKPYTGKGFGRESEDLNKKEYREGIDMWEEPQEDKPIEREESKVQTINRINTPEKKIKPEEDIFPINKERISDKIR